MSKILEVTHISKVGSSFRITLPLAVRDRLKIQEGDILAFYEDTGEIYIGKID